MVVNEHFKLIEFFLQIFMRIIKLAKYSILNNDVFRFLMNVIFSLCSYVIFILSFQRMYCCNKYTFTTRGAAILWSFLSLAQKHALRVVCTQHNDGNPDTM